MQRGTDDSTQLRICLCLGRKGRKHPKVPSTPHPQKTRTRTKRKKKHRTRGEGPHAPHTPQEQSLACISHQRGKDPCVQGTAQPSAVQAPRSGTLFSSQGAVSVRCSSQWLCPSATGVSVLGIRHPAPHLESVADGAGSALAERPGFPLCPDTLGCNSKAQSPSPPNR